MLDHMVLRGFQLLHHIKQLAIRLVSIKSHILTRNMISPTAASLVYNNNPYTLYTTVPGGNTNTLATVPQLLPNLTNTGLQPAPQVSAPSLMDPALTTLGSMGSLQNLNSLSVNNLLMVTCLIFHKFSH